MVEASFTGLLPMTPRILFTSSLWGEASMPCSTGHFLVVCSSGSFTLFTLVSSLSVYTIFHGIPLSLTSRVFSPFFFSPPVKLVDTDRLRLIEEGFPELRFEGGNVEEERRSFAFVASDGQTYNLVYMFYTTCGSWFPRPLLGEERRTRH